MSDLVDKNWKRTGLARYSTEAIVGTLRHYGAEVDEGAFKQMAQTLYPLGIASEWIASWEGVGQFKDFPVMAAQELWGRWEKDRASPLDFLRPIAHLLMDLDLLLDKEPQARPQAAFEAVEALFPKLPRKDGQVDELFAGELYQSLPEDMQDAFDGMAETLAQEGQGEWAVRFAKLEEALMPDRASVSLPMLDAKLGKKEEALATLAAVAKDRQRSGHNRMAALDALIYLESPEARAAAEMLLDDGEKAEDHHLALNALSRMGELLEQAQDKKGLAALEARANKLMEAHQKAHPHHAH